MNHRFHTLDVFTTTRFQGNPLAVITDGDGLSNDQMLAIAREMNLSETVFVQKPTDDRALARLRIFTTKEELKLAGHPGDRHMVSAWRNLVSFLRKKVAFTSCNRPAPAFFPLKFASRMAGRSASR